MKLLKKYIFIFIFSGIVISNTFAANKPFPQNLTYPYGIKPDNISQSVMNTRVQNLYDLWKNDYLLDAGTDGSGHQMYRINCNKNEDGDTVSEGQGYGMLITVVMAGYDSNAQSYFDGLYWFFNKYKNSSGLMKWYIDASGNPSDNDNATDGDLDIALALIMADAQWGSGGSINYAAEALNQISAIMVDNIDTAGYDGGSYEDDDWSVRPGGWWLWDSNHLTRTSDFMTAHFKIFAQFASDNNWTNVRTRCYELINKMQNTYSSADLVPDFIRDNSESPANAYDLEGPHDGHYHYNACRVPWRITIDYLQFGNTEASNSMDKMANFIVNKTGWDPDNVSDGYELDGTVYGSDYGPNVSSWAFTSPFGVAGMVSPAYQSWVNNTFDFISTGSSQGYYEDSIRLLSAFVMSGNWWNPLSGNTIPVVALENPPNGSFFIESRTNLKWTDKSSSGVNLYQVDVSTNSDFSTHFNGYPLNVSTNNCIISNLSFAKYYWKVRCSIDEGTNWGDWSGIDYFTVVASGGAQTNKIDYFEDNPVSSNNPYNPTNITDNDLGGYWYCIDDQSETFSYAQHSKALTLEIISNDTYAISSLRSLHTTYTLGVSDETNDEWAYWQLECTLSSNLIKRDLTGKTIDFYIKGITSYTLSIVLVPPSSESSKYGDDFYKHYFGITTNWQHVILPVTTNYFKQDGWGTNVAFSDAVKEVTAIDWAHDAPTSGTRQLRGFYLDDVKFTENSSTNNTPPSINNLSVNQTNDGSGKVIIRYTGVDAENNNCIYKVKAYSTNSNVWTAMTPKTSDSRHSSEPLPFTSAGKDLTFIWDSKTDIPGIYDNSVWIKLQVSDGTVDSSIIVSPKFTVDNSSPMTVSLEAPTNNAKTSQKRPTFKWNSLSDSETGIKNYQISIDSSTIDTINTNYTPTSDLSDGTHSWRVRAIDNKGNYGAWSVTRNIIVDFTPPEQVQIISPIDGYLTTNQNPIFIWNKATNSDVAYYELSIGTKTTNINSTNCIVNLNEGVYIWKVRAIDDVGNIGNWSSGHTIKIDTNPPLTVSLQSPSSNSTIDSMNYNFQWDATADAVSGVSNYILQLSTDKNFGSFIVNATTGETSYAVNNLVNDVTNWWRVRAYDKVGHTNSWSSVWGVFVNTNVIIPTLYTPQNNSTVNTNNPIYIWSKENVDRYKIIIKSNGTIKYSDTTTETNIQLGNLNDGTGYTWSVSATNATGGGWFTAGGPYTFTVDTTGPSQVQLISPISNSSTTNTTINFCYEQAIDILGNVAYYEILVDTEYYTNSGNSNTNYTITNLSVGSHIWRVRAIDNVGNIGKWSSEWNFEIRVNDTIPPAQVILISPENDAFITNVKPIFIWHPATDNVSISYYQIVIDNTTNTVTETNYIAANELERGKKYLWKVRAIDTSGNKGNWSGERNFTIKTIDVSTKYKSPRVWNTVIKPEEDTVRFIGLEKGMTIEIYTLTRKKIDEIKVNAESEEWKIPTDLETGVYIVYFRYSSGESKILKLVRIK